MKTFGSQNHKNQFWAHSSEIPPFLRFGAPKRKNHHFEPKMRKIAKFPFFAFWRSGRTHPHTYRGQDPQSLPPSRASGTKPVGGAPLPPTPMSFVYPLYSHYIFIWCFPCFHITIYIGVGGGDHPPTGFVPEAREGGSD